MTDRNGDWTAFDEAMRAYVKEFAMESKATPAELVLMPRWVQRNGKYVREVGNRFSVAQSVSNRAFYLESFPALEAIFYDSPLKPYLPGAPPTGAGSQTYVHPRDIAIRMAWRAIKVGMDGRQRLDEESLASDIGSLHELVESKTRPMELIGVVLGAQVTEPIQLREDLRVSSLGESEIDAFLSMLPFPMTMNKSTQEWEVLLPAPVALMRLEFEQPPDQPIRDVSPDLREEFERFADAVALHHDARPLLFLERSWDRCAFLRGGWNDTMPNGIGLVEKSAVVTEAAGVVEACDALRKLAIDAGKSAVPTAIRRLGLTRTRALSDDVLIDAVIALEALLLERTERDELAKRMSARAAKWATEWGADSSATYDLAKRAYNMRSALVHGEAPKKNSTYKIGGVELGYEKLVSQVADLGRRIGADALTRSLDESLAVHWESLLKASSVVGPEDAEN